MSVRCHFDVIYLLVEITSLFHLVKITEKREREREREVRKKTGVQYIFHARAPFLFYSISIDQYLQAGIQSLSLELSYRSFVERLT